MCGKRSGDFILSLISRPACFVPVSWLFDCPIEPYRLCQCNTPASVVR